MGGRHAILPDFDHAPAEEPLMLHMEAKYASRVLPSIARELRAGRPRAILFTVTRFEFGVAFSQEYPYHVYAVGQAGPGVIPFIIRLLLLLSSSSSFSSSSSYSPPPPTAQYHPRRFGHSGQDTSHDSHSA
jgi:hypothetical protein